MKLGMFVSELPDRTQTGLTSKAQCVVGVKVTGIKMGKPLPLVVNGGGDVDQEPGKDDTALVEDGMPKAQGVSELEELGREPEDADEVACGFDDAEIAEPELPEF